MSDQFSSQVGDVVDYSDMLLRMLWSLSVEVLIPVGLGILGVGASLLVGGASILVAYFSWKTAKKATKIAEDAADAEKRRDERAVERELRMVEEERERRLDTAVENLIVATHGWVGNVPDQSSEQGFQVIGAIQRIDMIATPSQAKVTGAFNANFSYASKHLGEAAAILVGRSLTALAFWRNGRISDEEAVAELMKQLELMKKSGSSDDAKDDPPARVTPSMPTTE